MKCDTAREEFIWKPLCLTLWLSHFTLQPLDRALASPDFERICFFVAPIHEQVLSSRAFVEERSQVVLDVFIARPHRPIAEGFLWRAARLIELDERSQRLRYSLGRQGDDLPRELDTVRGDSSAEKK